MKKDLNAHDFAGEYNILLRDTPLTALTCCVRIDPPDKEKITYVVVHSARISRFLALQQALDFVNELEEKED